MQTTSEIQHSLSSLYFSTMKTVQHKKAGLCGETCKQDFGTLIGKPIHSNVLFVPKSKNKKTKRKTRNAVFLITGPARGDVCITSSCIYIFYSGIVQFVSSKKSLYVR